jgi:LexA-binding, inner membrane-associated putative hydrolase
MPHYKTHALAVVGVYILMLLLLPMTHHVKFPTLVEWLLCALLGGLFPDIDIKSKGQRIFYGLIAGILTLLIYEHYYYSACLLGAVSFLPLFVSHRGLFHQAWFIVTLAITLFGGASFCIPLERSRWAYDILFFLGGALSHLLLDKKFVRKL